MFLMCGSVHATLAASLVVVLLGLPTVSDAAGTGKITDTGITQMQCLRKGDQKFVSCTSKGALVLNRNQDGMIGLDVVSPNSRNGKLGFNYTKISGDGNRLPINAAEWVCVKDNITGLIWEVKTADGGWRDVSNTYTNYGDGRVGEVSAYVEMVNAVGLCGKRGWRLPTR